MTEKEEKPTATRDGGRTPPEPPALPPDSQFNGGINKPFRGPREETDDSQHPKFAAPIWMEEIQKNKIFNRQKRLLSEDKLRDLSDEQVPLTLPPPQQQQQQQLLVEPSLPEPPGDTN